MCGIIGYLGKNEAVPILVEGLRAMEYRGYDSSGVVVVNGEGRVRAVKEVGKLINLEKRLSTENLSGQIGIGHERWATHGGVTVQNAHPHSDCVGRVWVVHNGIVENYRELREDLEASGHIFVSETDSEVVAHLLEEEQRKERFELVSGVQKILPKLRGAYGLVFMDSANPKILVAARNFSPLVLGLGEGEYFIASDPSAVIERTRRVVYLEDGEIAVVYPDRYRILATEGELNKSVDILEESVIGVKKAGYQHFMLKEICEEADAVRNSLRGRLLEQEGVVKLGGLVEVQEDLRRLKRLLIVGCGTSFYAGKIGKLIVEECADLPVEVEVASEFRYSKPIFQEGDALLALSQSGETADTLAAVREAKKRGILTLGIVNVIGSSLARETDAGVYQHIGPEVSVASTKAFVSQVTILTLLAIFLKGLRDGFEEGNEIVSGLNAVPSLIEKILNQREDIRAISERYAHFPNFFYLGRKYSFPVALEGALKLKEISYLHAEGIAAGEMKHGPIALIDKNCPTWAIVPKDSTVYEKTMSNIQEIKARGGPILAVATEGDQRAMEMASEIIFVPKIHEILTSLLSIIPLQLFAYYLAVARGLDVDQPRNLAKSVTVE